MRLAEHRPDAAHLEHQPLERAIAAAQVGRQEAPGLGSEVEQDRARFEQRDRLAVGAVGIDDRRDLVVRADRQELGCELRAGADVDRNRAIGQAAFLEHDVDLVAIGRRPRIHFDHRSDPRAGSPRPASDSSGSETAMLAALKELVRQGVPRRRPARSRPGRARTRTRGSARRTATASPSTAVSTPRPGVSNGAGRSGRYIAGHELRLRIALGLPPDLQMLVMTRSLKETLENEAYEHAVQSTRTQVGTTGAEEMRWLALFPKISFGASKILRSTFAGVSSLAPRGTGLARGRARARPRARDLDLARRRAAVPVDDLARPALPASAARVRGRDRRRRGGRSVPDRGRRSVARRPHARRRAGALDRVAPRPPGSRCRRSGRASRPALWLSRAGRARPWRSRCGGLRRGRRRSAACARRRSSRRAGSRPRRRRRRAPASPSRSPAAPCSARPP